MTSKIRILDELTINQIAAGEVIENPSSVVKELVENALDAGSTEITIEIKGGGRQLVRITDNGCGMSNDDALLCIERHATSKLKQFEDLNYLHTMGFRGEALPSIASISQFILQTKTQDSNEGTILIVEGGKITKCAKCPKDMGTTIEVKNLFFNVPVRRKFQKSPAHDSNEILKCITSLSLAHPTIRFELIIDNKSSLTAPSNSKDVFLDALKLRIQDVLGFSFFEDLSPFSYEDDNYKAEGYVSLPYNNRPNKSGQFLFVNGRSVSSPLISFAIKDGYGPSLPNGRFPIFVLHLHMPTQDFDINVHPQKKEVRFRKGDAVKEFFKKGIELSLQSPKNELFSMPEISFEKSFPVIPERRYATYALPKEEKSFSLPTYTPVVTESLPLPKIAFKPNCIACFFDYIVLDSPPESLKGKEGICLVHKKYAYSRIIYEKALKSLQDHKGSLGSQALLIPITLELPADVAEVLRQNQEKFSKLGFEIREFGPKSFFIESIPEHLQPELVEDALKTMLNSIKEGLDALTWQKDESQKIALAAARVNLGKKIMTISEAQILVHQLLDCQQPYFSPFGQSVFALLPSETLQNLFKK